MNVCTVLNSENEMNVLRFSKDGFSVRRTLLSRDIFNAWTEAEGKPVLHKTLAGMRWRWFFGNIRAIRSLNRAVRRALHPRSPFAQALEQHLNRLPAIIRTIAVLIIQKGYSDLYSIDTTQALVVVPRGIVRNDFRRELFKQLEGGAELKPFAGLSRRLLDVLAADAELLLFSYIQNGKTYVDSDYRGVFLGTDLSYGWKLNGFDGHYYYAFTLKQGGDLKNKRILRRFKADMTDILIGQKRYLNSLAQHQIFDIAQTIRAQQPGGTRSQVPPRMHELVR